MDPVLIGSGFLILAAVVWVVCVIYAYRMAPTFGRSAITWAILAVFFGPIALMILYIMPKHEPAPGHGHHKHTDPQAALYEKPKKH